MGKSAKAKNVHYFFRMKKNNGGTDWDVLSVLTDNVAAAPALTDVALKLTKSVSSKPNFQKGGTVNMDFSNFEVDIVAFLNKVISQLSSADTLPDILWENGIKETAGVTSDEIILYIGYFHDDDLTSPTKTFVIWATGDIDETSGSFEAKGNDWTQMKIAFVGRKIDLAMTIPMEIFDDDLVTVLADKTIAKDTSYGRDYLTIAP